MFILWRLPCIVPARRAPSWKRAKILSDTHSAPIPGPSTTTCMRLKVQRRSTRSMRYFEGGSLVSPVQPLRHCDTSAASVPPMSTRNELTELRSHDGMVAVGVNEAWSESARNTRFHVNWVSLSDATSLRRALTRPLCIRHSSTIGQGDVQGECARARVDVCREAA